LILIVQMQPALRFNEIEYAPLGCSTAELGDGKQHDELLLVFECQALIHCNISKMQRGHERSPV
jgi:hypothetical protein